MVAPTRTPRPILHDCVDDELVGHIRKEGFGALTGAVTPDQISQLNAETLRLCRGELGELKLPKGKVIDASAAVTDDNLLRQFLCIHFPHKLSTIMAATIHLPPIVDVLTRLLGPNVKCMQSMLFIKSDGKPGQAWHQDEYFIPSRDRSLTAAWIALDDATVDNGCLWVLPGSHARGIIFPEHQHEDPRFDCAIEAHGFPYRDEDAVPVEVPAGSIVFFNGYLLHRSLPNTRAGSYRRALINHYMSAESTLMWRKPREDEHMARADYRDIVMVAGEDPYAWKGTEDLARAYVRADREGGCDR